MLRKILSFFGKKKHSTDKPKFSLENAFELDPIDFVQEFCYKFKRLDADNWIVQHDLPSNFFQRVFRSHLKGIPVQVDLVWNAEKFIIERSLGIFEGEYAEFFKIIHTGESILTLVRLKDYGECFSDWKYNLERINPELQLCSENPIAFIQTRCGKGLMLERFGHTQIWMVEDWAKIEKTILKRESFY